MNEFSWVGSHKSYVDKACVQSLQGEIVLGLFGGNSSSGQFKNEDGCLIWTSPGEWEFAMILDGHDSAESVELVIQTFENNKDLVQEIIHKRTRETFVRLQEFILETFVSESFREEAEKVQGEAACLFVLRKDNYLWWFSVGDCIIHLFHPELAALGEFQQNHRSFYEWVGNNSTFNKAVPSYSTGTKELRTGENQIFLTTDGLTECQNTYFSEPATIMDAFGNGSLVDGVHNLLQKIKRNQVKDSTTIVTWKVMNNQVAVMPSDMK
ncbi:protein phosphatase 2C domain-containing protein [Bacillus haikouensis]|uniref:protein phosphatase 2C domain-containing protein n=1 Tax=Bacillus haikouensis TaxID=1510468 RepID=UPI0015541635|nr:protein phosphatase 2C domain-containing protein [Bacillus haikouensis]NQD64445.1 protein phosphatase 2C domain-containing protein [Bacillus haikouensis]